MKGYVLVQKDKGRPIRIAVQNDQGEFNDGLKGIFISIGMWLFLFGAVGCIIMILNLVSA